MHLVTKTAIAERLAEDLQASLGQVIPEDIYDNDLLASPLNIKVDSENSPVSNGFLPVYRATRQDEISALAFRQVATGGYGGPIQLLLGVDPNGKLLGVRVLSHKETPGLGDKIERAKSDWIESFKGRSLDDPTLSQWTVKKQGGQFDQFTGATITPKAVILGIKAGLQFFKQQRQSLLVPIVSPTEDAADATPHSPPHLSPVDSRPQDGAQTPVLPPAAGPITQLPPAGGLK
jgi:electron transport complex protein RnfG